MIVLGDIQACYKTLRALQKKFPKGEKVCVAGDMIDKGPNARDTVQFIIDQGWDAVMGNHEKMMLEDGCAFRIRGNWGPSGGLATLRSYADNPEDDALFEKHCNWIRDLPYYREYFDVINEQGQYLFVSHAGIPYEDLQVAVRTQQILWNREEVPFKYRNAFNIFGHTPTQKITIGEYYAAIDTGCFYTHSGYGRMSALRFPQMEIYEQENIDCQWHMGHEVKKRYHLVSDLPSDMALRDFSSKPAVLRWVAQNQPRMPFKLFHGEEVPVEFDEMVTAYNHVAKGGSWMDPLSKQEWIVWADANLTSEQKKVRLHECRSCNIKYKAPEVYCDYCGRTPDDPIFQRKV